MEFTGSDPGPVVIGIDRSGSAREAVVWAAGLASAWGAGLHLVHAVPPLRDAAEPLPWFGELLAGAERAGYDNPRAGFRLGHPVEVLSGYAADARMLVLGSQGAGSWSGVLTGSVALALLGRVGCPVAVVRGRSAQVPPPTGGPVVVGVDGSPAGRAALDLAADLAVSLGAPMVAVHTWSEGGAGSWGVSRRSGGSGFPSAEGAARLEAELATLAVSCPGLAVERDVTEDTPVRALLDRAEGARLLVVGHRGPDHRSGGVLGGSTSRALVEFASCPVVVTTPTTTIATGPTVQPAKAG